MRLLSGLEMWNCCSLAANHNIQQYLVYTFMVDFWRGWLGFEFTAAWQVSFNFVIIKVNWRKYRQTFLVNSCDFKVYLGKG